MKFKQSLGELSTKELEERLKEKKEAYADLEEEMEFTLSQTGIHLPGNAKENYEKQLAEIEEEINNIKELLANRD